MVAITSVAAILSKYIFRSRSANVFNPAALAIIASFYVFHTGQSWWGALTEVPLPSQLVLVAAGVFITDRVNKMPLVLSFLGTYFLLFTVTAFVSDPRWVSEIYRPPDLEAAVYFAFIILTDPPTSPAKYPDQIVCGRRLVLAEGSSVSAEVRGGTPQAHRRPTSPAGPALTAPRCRVPHDAVASRPPRVARRLGHHARPLVAEDGARSGVALQDHVQVGSADPARRDLDEHFAGPGFRPRDLVDRDPAVSHVDGSGHQFG